MEVGGGVVGVVFIVSVILGSAAAGLWLRFPGVRTCEGVLKPQLREHLLALRDILHFRHLEGIQSLQLPYLGFLLCATHRRQLAAERRVLGGIQTIDVCGGCRLGARIRSARCTRAGGDFVSRFGGRGWSRLPDGAEPVSEEVADIGR